MHTKTITAVSALTLFASAGLAQTSTWNLTTDGFWSVPTNWTPVTAPITMTSDAFIPNNGTYTIRISGNFPTDDITNDNPNATIALDASRQHELFGNFDNDGVYIVNQTNGGALTTLFWRDTATISGSGSILLNGFTTRARFVVDTGSTLTNGANHTIHGFGQIFGDFINNGTIQADNPFNTLDFRFGNVTNNGVIGATNDGILSLNLIDLIINQSPSGVIRADGGEVSLNQTTISGGIVEGINGGAVVSNGTPTFDDVTVSGNVQVAPSRTLNLSDTITNNGLIQVNPTNGAAATVLDADNDVLLTGSGIVRLGGFTTRAQITTSGGGTITNDTDHSIDGFGRIFASMTNNGSISANSPGQTLLIFSEGQTNNNMMSADGGLMELNSFTLDQTGGGTLAANTSNIIYSGATVLGGTLTSGSGFHDIVTDSTFDAVTSQGEIQVNAGDTLQISGSITNNGEILVNPNNGAAQTNLTFIETGAFNGTGTLTLNGFSTRAQLAGDPGVLVTNGANHTIHGFGRIITPVINDGMINADVAGQEIIVTASIQNNNTIQSDAGAILELSTGSDVLQASGAKIAADDGEIELQNTTIIGGSIESTGIGVFNVQIGTSRLASVTSNANVQVEAGQTLELSGSHTNNALINVNPNNGAAVTRVDIQQDITINGTGELRLNGISTRSQITSVTGTEVLTNGADHTITGIGMINTDLVNNGTIAPGLSAGTISASSPISLSDSSVLEIEVAGLSSHDLIDSSSTFHADGTLDLSLIDGFTPTESWVVTIVTADAGVTGTFDTLIAPPPADPRLTYRIGYFDDEIRVGAVCDTDFDFSGGLNFLDVSIFLSLYADMNPIADLTGEGQFNFLDISAFLANYGQSCP
jgi:hypothetical protein